jgi:nitrogen fixation NifU-like protein
MTVEIYRARILDHFQRPRHRGSLEGMQAVGRAAIPMCGDEIEVGVGSDGEAQFGVRFRGRGCAVCIASASMMAELANGLDRGRAAEIGRAFTGWMLEGADVAPLTAMVPELVETFSAVRAAGGRARCAALPWSALADALVRCSGEPQVTMAPEATDAAGRTCSAPG